jgi:hypothetical protein
MDETGILHQYQLITHLETKGKEVIVVDATALLANPRGTLMALCERLEIPWYEEMLQWPAGPKKCDGAWAYVMHSTVL